MSGPAQREIEAALVVAATDAAAVFVRLAARRTLGPHRLRSRPTRRFRDRYLDTPARDLWRRRLTVRERQVDGKRLIALKGQLGPRERLEIEGHDDRAAWARIAAALRNRHLHVDRGDLEVIRELWTTRQRRAVTTGGRAIAELALDEVDYQLAGRSVRLHVAEIELEDPAAALDALLVDVRTAAPELREWPFTKLATGDAIAAAVQRDELAAGADGALQPRSLEHLARLLTAGEPW